MSLSAPCAGVVVFDGDMTILVCTERGHYSIPKGKRNKGETDIQTALRELQEETGLTNDYIELLDDFTLDEINERGNLTIRYYVAKLIKEKKTFTFDAKELGKVEWIRVEDTYKLEGFLDRRKEIVKKAYMEFISRNT
ncbi:NUDIX hydrolase [Fadolivirus algeromassiliense]|jgi:diadenosine hexaphosphate hydrolase (ATP-forming)|uniref:NUDIX hydrolase n=1 Tax=Fadolivirus FV1/VV64 TaxID=3070911 RepID=A0A7D3URL0_9VIRU|nr:NUDIX hydrolase [Fadolivirus algeromassiliense]QKF94753.1 NUDIX hydrolase [Fadolivirus FV1/VV64]